MMPVTPVVPRSRSPFQSLVDARRQDKFPRASSIYRQGESSSSVYYLESGLVKLTHRLEDQREFLVRLVPAGELFGEASLFSESHRKESAETLREAVIHEFPRGEFLETCRNRPEIWQWVAELERRRLDEAEHRLQLISFYRVEQRILMVLAALTPVFDAGVEDEGNVLVPLSQSELASLVGATRETTSTMLNTLERRGLLKLGRRSLTILSGKALRMAMTPVTDAATAGR
jgi:CRP/FNR family transcriptional regulator